jgi:hypothetical protein
MPSFECVRLLSVFGLGVGVTRKARGVKELKHLLVNHYCFQWIPEACSKDRVGGTHLELVVKDQVRRLNHG